MKITKYPQSCLLIEEDGKRILIDAGSFVFEKFQIGDLGKVDAILVTHQHSDHLDKARVGSLIASGVPLYGNHDVAQVLQSENVEITKVENELEFEAAGFKIKPIDLPHCKMADGSDGPPNTGFIINGHFFHPGDGIELVGTKAAGAAIPITGPTIDFEKAWQLAKNLEAKKVIPIHYSNPAFTADPTEFAKVKPPEVEVIILQDGQSTEI